MEIVKEFTCLARVSLRDDHVRVTASHEVRTSDGEDQVVVPRWDTSRYLAAQKEVERSHFLCGTGMQ
jgi:hypothetical protein